MAKTGRPKNYDEIIADRLKRVERLETGGREFLDFGSTAKALDGFTINNNVGITLNNTVSWNDDLIAANPGVDVYWSMYVDNDALTSYRWPDGADTPSGIMVTEWKALHRLTDESKSYHSYYILNESGSAIDVYFYTKPIYVAAQSGSSA